MANKNGIITRKDIIEDEALNFGKVYAENVETAIKSNKVLVESVKELNKQVQNFKTANTQKDYISAKQAEELATKQAINAIKQQEAAELSALKVKKQFIATEEAERKAKQAALDTENKIQKAKEKSVKLTLEERVQQELVNKAERQAVMEKLGLVSAYQKMNQARTEAKNKLRDLMAVENASVKEIEKAKKAYEELDAKVKKADHAVGDFTKNVGNYPTGGKLLGGLKDIAGAFGLMGGVAAAGALLKDALNTIKEFDQGLADLSAITGASGKDLDYLRNRAIELGKATKGGAVQVVEAYKLIASAKPELLENVQALDMVTDATLTLSKASGMELPEAATALTDAMNQFNAPAEQAGMFIDALANGAKYGAAEIPQVTEALLKFGAVAKSSNISIGESTALIELLAEKGLKGAEAGTALRNVLLKISAPDALPKNAQEALSSLGISFQMLKDNTIPVQEKFEALKPLLTDNAKMVKVFGVENVVAAKNIIGHTDRLKDLISKMGEAGSAEEQAAIRTNTLEGSMDRLSATWDSLVLTISKGSGPVANVFKSVINGATWLTEQIGRASSSWDELFNTARSQGMADGVKEFNKELQKTIKETGLSQEKATAAVYSKSTENFNRAAREMNAFREKNVALTKAMKLDAEDTKIFLSKGGANPRELERLIKQLATARSKMEAAKSALNKKDAPAEPNQVLTSEESDEEIKKRLEREKKARQDYLEFLKKFENDAYNLEKFRLDRTSELAMEFANDEKRTLDERLENYQKSEKAKKSSADLTLKHELVQNALSQIDAETTSTKKMDAIKRAAENQANLLIKGVALSKNATNDEKLIYEKYLKEKEDLQRKSQENIQKIIDSAAEHERKKVESTLQEHDTALNAKLQAENEFFLATLKQYDTYEEALKNHEKRKLEITRDFAKQNLLSSIETLQAILDAQKALPENERISKELIAKYEHDLAVYRKQLSDENVGTQTGSLKEIEEANKKYTQVLTENAKQLGSALVDVTNAVFDAKIQSIDQELEKNDEFYSKQIELAGNDQKQKDLLQAEAEKKRSALEDKKRKEQIKQAIFNKLMSVANIGIQTAMASMAALAPPPIGLGPVLGGTLLPLIIGAGALQAAAVLATPIPKYKMGRKGGPAEFAEVGDGFVHEIIEKADGRAFMTPNKPTLTYLEEGDKVHSSVDEYLSLQKSAMMASISMQGRKMSDYEAAKVFDDVFGKEMLTELREIRKNSKSQKPIIIHNKIDLDHHFWKMKNSKWD